MSTTPDSADLSPDTSRGRITERAASQRTQAKYLPVSFSQQRLWFLDQLIPGNAFYNEHTSFRFSFPLNVAVFEQCLAELVRRHDALRTTFRSVEGQPVQVIAPAATIPLPVIDLRHLPGDERPAAAARLASEEVGRPFDLGTGPLARTTLLRLDDSDYLFLLTLHHIISDGWSLGILGRELQALYPAFATGQPSPLAPLAIQYGDFAVWQRRRLQGQALDEQLTYWKERLTDAPTLEMPTDRPRPPTASFRGAAHSVIYPSSLLSAVRGLGHEEGATLFMTLLAGFQLLLARYSGQDDVVVGVPVANRDRVELESVIGFFVNTLAMRTRLTDRMTVRELLRQVRTTAIEAYAHQDLPFERLVEALQPRRDLSRNPVFQVVFQLFAGHGHGSAQAVLPTIDVQATTAKFDLTVHMTECAEGLFARFEYSTDLFDASTIARLAAHYERLLTAMAARPDHPAARLTFLSESEQQQRLVDWNTTTSAYPRDASLQELFEAQVARTPDNLAVCFDGVELTYRGLNRRANALAATLRDFGIGPDVPVAVLVERSLEMVVAVVATIKAGGAYVPMDPAYPAERIRLMLADTAAPVLLTQVRLRQGVPPGDTHVVLLDTPGTGTSTADERDVPGGANPTSLAYIIYTSGSTGVPKGVAVEQRSVVRLVRNTTYIQFAASDRIAQVSSFSFDAATFEIWGALLNGAALIGIRKDIALSAADFARTLQDERITTMFLTAALLRHVASEVPDAFRSMRTMMFGGEAADPESVARVLAHGRPQRLINGYGPTESTTFATCYEVDAVPPGAVTVPIGRPISNTQVYVLDQRRQLVPTGVAGELFIAGDGLARGYLNDAALTADRFVPHPFSSEPGARLYRTGDRVRQRADGVIEYLGRLDHQLKVRGFRVEPGEIEAVLRGYDGVRDVLVMLREDRPGDRRLVVYVVTSDGGPIRGLELRRALQERLPDYMVPSAVVCLPALPLNANGKVDRRRLPSPDLSAGFGPGVAPSTELECAIADIWRETLQIEHAGVDDNFFDLGGHSLLMAQIHSRLKTALSRDVPMIDLFRFPTVRSLAGHLASAQPNTGFLRDTQERATRQRARPRRPHVTRGDEAR